MPKRPDPKVLRHKMRANRVRFHPDRPPDHEKSKLTLRELDLGGEMGEGLRESMLRDELDDPYLKAYLLGECSVIVTRQRGLFHLSITGPDRLPTWEELSTAWYRAIPDSRARRGQMELPPIDEYINAHPFCFQVHEVPR